MYKSLQAGRAIAAVLVVLFHLGGAIAAEKYFGIKAFAIPFSFGGFGVDFFFVLSGFIIFYAHKDDIGKPKELYSYLYKRITRIYPVYLIVFTGVCVLAIITSQLRDAVPHDIEILIKSILLLPQDKGVVGGTGAPVLAVAWTLQFEMLFYLAFSFGIINKKLGVFFIVLFILLSLLSIETYNFSFPFNFISSNYIWLFLMGMLSAKLISLKAWSLNFSFMSAVTGASICLLTAFDIIAGYNQLEKINTVLNGIGCSLIVLSMVSYEKKGKVFLGNKFFQLLGASSYALYLLHYPLISFLCKFSLFLGLQKLGVAGAFMTYIFIFSVCILVSIVFHLIIEKPMAKKLKLLAKKT